MNDEVTEDVAEEVEEVEVKSPEDCMAPEVRRVFERGQAARAVEWEIQNRVTTLIEELKVDYPDFLDQVRKQVYGGYQQLLTEKGQRDRERNKVSGEPKADPGANGVSGGVSGVGAEATGGGESSPPLKEGVG